MSLQSYSIVVGSGISGIAQPVESPRYASHPAWLTGQRYFESAETTRLNSAHWAHADDESINVWLAAHLAEIRSRAIYEDRNNALLKGIVSTHADDIVGPDGPTLQVQSEDQAFNEALERVWRDWFAAPTIRRNISGAALLRLWVRNLWKCGEFLAQIVTDPAAEGPVALRLKPIHPRRLATPATFTGDDSVVMGIRFDSLGRPTQYFITESTSMGVADYSMGSYATVPPDLVIHEYLVEEEDQVRGVPLASPSLQSSADLRDYDDQMQDAARQTADQHGMLYTDNPTVTPHEIPTSTNVYRRAYRMAPPGWKPYVYPATLPPVQYPDYRAERMRELGRHVGMPLLMIRLDASKHNYSSARLDTQVYRRAIASFQTWLSGSDRSCGTLNRLVDEVAAEARFSVPELRVRPEGVLYRWTWPALPHVDPQKEANAEKISLEAKTQTLTGALAARGTDLESHLATLRRERDLLEEAGLADPPPETTDTEETEARLAALELAFSELEDFRQEMETTRA